ncbi:hypothetical protein H4Q26_001764 [Puccinia striiformis f. sp. tritici PST-130]|nr:hypothetical protein H4Q26_001764 [Puccinia striiformis f. sp. tritici PST-130]
MYPKDDYVEVVSSWSTGSIRTFLAADYIDFYTIFCVITFRALTSYLHSQSYDYDFSKLSLAVGLVYVYALALPACIWAAMRYWAGVEGRTIPEIINLYGYSVTVFIPVALLSIPPFPFLRSIMALGAFGLSLGFLVRNLYPVLAAAPAKTARILLIAVVGLHAIFSLILYFGYLSIGGSFENVIDTPVLLKTLEVFQVLLLNNHLIF